MNPTTPTAGTASPPPGYPRPDCRRRWANHRKCLRLTYGLFFSFLPFTFFFAVLSILAPATAPPRLVLIPILLYLAACLFFGHLCRTFHCPRCGAPFYAPEPGHHGHNGFARQCRNCHLPKWHCS